MSDSLDEISLFGNTGIISDCEITQPFQIF